MVEGTDGASNSAVNANSSTEPGSSKTSVIIVPLLQKQK